MRMVFFVALRVLNDVDGGQKCFTWRTVACFKTLLTKYSVFQLSIFRSLLHGNLVYGLWNWCECEPLFKLEYC